MAHIRRLITDADFQEALELRITVRVFRDDHMIESGSQLIRYDEKTVVLQAGVSELSYHPRGECEFFELRKK